MKQTAWIIFIFGALISTPAVAQQQVIPPGIEEQTILVDVDLVNVLFTVADKKGKFVTGLKQEHFKVYEDGRLQTTTNFSSDADLPLTIALLVDTSGSVRDRLQFEKEAAIEFLHSTLIRGKDQAVVVGFDTRADLIQDYSDDPAKLAESVRTMRAGGATALYDAIHLAVTEKLTGQDGRRIIVVISDGDDNSSHLSMTEVLESAQRNDVVIYAISTNSFEIGRDRNHRGDDVLKKLSEETGGKVFFPFQLRDLSSNFRDITEELRFQYALAYRPTNLNRDGSFRRIRIEPVDNRHVVRSRNGYYAPRATSSLQ